MKIRPESDVVRSLKHDCQLRRPREMTIINFVAGRREITLIDPYVLSFRKSRSLVSFMRASREWPRPRAVDFDADADADVDADAGAAREATSARHVRFLVLCTRSIGAAGVRLTALSRPAAAPRYRCLYTVSPNVTAASKSSPRSSYC